MEERRKSRSACYAPVMNTITRLLTFLALAAVASPALAHEPQALAAADYARAERFLAHHTDPLVDGAVTGLAWEDDGHVVFQRQDASGDLALRMDAATGIVMPAAAAATDTEADEATPEKPADDAEDAPPVVVSPDGRHAAFIRDWNLWVRDTTTAAETPLTTDGVTDFGYATDNAGWTHSDRPILVWSPDSTKIATFQQDQRRTGSMTLVSTNVGHPVVETWKYPLVGDEHVTMIERVVIDVPARAVVRLDMPPDQHRSTLCDDVSCSGGWEDVQWTPDSTSLAFASTSRDHKDTWLRVADPVTGAVRTVYHEHAPTYFESGNGAVNWKYLPASDEFIWFSEREGWGHLYLHDLSSGALKHAITTGEGNVTEVLRVDAATRTLWFRGVGREPGRNPYYQHFYKVAFGGGAPVLLTPEDANHDITLSPDGTYFVDAYSTPTTAPVTVLRASADGRLVADIARADLSRLRAAGWVPPEPFTVKARDGKTDLYGLMFKPTHFDASRRYPLVVYVYPGPQTGSVRGRSFASARRDHQALAELGREVAGPGDLRRRGSQPLRGPGEPEPRREPAGQAVPRPRDDGRQRPAVFDAAGGRCTGEGQQGLRPAAVAARPPRLRRGPVVRDAPALGLLRRAPARRGAAGGLPHRAARGGLTRVSSTSGRSVPSTPTRRGRGKARRTRRHR